MGLISSRKSHHVPCIFSGLERSLVSQVPQVKSALISNNQGEVPLPRQSRATSHMFLTHRPALHHVLIIATTRDVTLERQQAAALGAEVKTAKLYIRTLKKKRLGVSKILKSSREKVKKVRAGAGFMPNICDSLCSYICHFS